MRIVMLGWELHPHNSGGLGVACYQLCKSLAQKGADIEFIVPYTADHAIDFMKITPASPQGVVAMQQTGGAYDSYKYVYSDGHVEYRDIFGQQQLYEHAVNELAKQKTDTFDIIHAHDWLTFRAALRLKQQTGLPLVIHLHSIERDRAGGDAGNPLVREIESLALLVADQIVAVSEHTKQAIIDDYAIPADKITVIHNSIDKAMLPMLDGNSSYRYLVDLKQQGYRVVVSLSRLTLQKNLVNLLYAAKAVIDRAPKTMFLIVGSGEQYFELVGLAADLGISKNVLFTGFLRGKRWRDAYAIADLFVMPSISEPFGLTALEAVGYGAPVLISKQSGVAEVLNNCLKVDFWDIKAMADKIAAVVQSDALRDELHANAFVEYDRLTWDNSAHKLFAVYDRHAARQGIAA